MNNFDKFICDLSRKIVIFGLFIVVFSNYSILAQSNQVGNLIVNSDGSRGIVFFVNPDGSGGWMVALNDASAGCHWGTNDDISNLYNINSTNYSGIYGRFYAALYDTAGFTNTQKIRNYQFNNTAFAAGKVDLNNGWYLPSMGQLLELYGSQPLINNAIISAGGTVLSTTNNYWSSTEYDVFQSWYLNSNDGKSNYIGNKNSTSYCVRAVRNFTNQTVVYDTTLTYLWNTGSNEPFINPSPISTTLYSVTATSGVGCSITASQYLYVHSEVPQIIYDTICVVYPYLENGFNIPASSLQFSGNDVYSQTIIQNDCEVTVQLYLYKKPNSSNVLNVSVCQTDPYTLNGIDYYTSGT